MTTTVGVIGAAGFAGAELVRILFGHPQFEVQVITSNSLAGKSLAEVNPTFQGLSDLCFSRHDDTRLFACDAVFLAVPHTAALKMVPALFEAGVAVFDLSADYRLKDPLVYEGWYGIKHSSPQLLAQAAFGLPELYRADLEKAHDQYVKGEATLVACAGCYPTASTLAAYPAVKEGLVTAPLIVDAISGVTGAGKTANERTHFCFANENLEAYAVGHHRHTPEIEQILNLSGQVIFTPHLAPLNRGLLATVYMTLDKDKVLSQGIEGLWELYTAFYADDCFVHMLEPGVFPQTAKVAGSNYAHIGLGWQEKTATLIVVTALDNVGKGAAGQAVQCANIVFGFPEDAGLKALACYV